MAIQNVVTANRAVGELAIQISPKGVHREREAYIDIQRDQEGAWLGGQSQDYSNIRTSHADL